uniref:Rho guanine nucleotide exchange factor (GEF) 11 n=1 Tax=Sinocyclocheilus rhinocerous TaxID=307959 RepID=A0A673FUV1_9TELE
IVVRLSSLTLGDSERRSSPGQQREMLSDLPSDNAGTGLVQRCVVVQRDNLGFGFTVCGERIKLVQNVRPGGAAVKAGVQEGDRIMKVNGSLVSSMSHQEVVKMIKCEFSSCTSSRDGRYELKTQSYFKHSTDVMKLIWRKSMSITVSKPLASLQERIESAKRRASQVRVKIQQDVVRFMDGPFQDMELLKSQPAHMTVFLRYVFSQLLDPNPLFLSCVCRVSVCFPAESRLHTQEDIRGPLSELQQQVLPDIQEQLQDYRSKQTMGLGSLFGESDLQQLYGDPVKERQLLDKQVLALWDCIMSHDVDRYPPVSSPLASAVHLYLRHSGIKLRDSRVFPGLMSEKEKWLPFFPKAKKLSSAKREKDGDDKKRNPILKYIGKPRSTSQSTFHVPLSPTEVRPGSVRNIIQQFENNSDSVEDGDIEGQSLSSSSFGEDSGAGAESVPRSHSDVDMDIDVGPGLRRLHHSASSSASSSSAHAALSMVCLCSSSHSLLCVCRLLDALLPDAPALDEDLIDSQNWQETVEPHVLTSLSSREIDRQAVIYELFTTEASHLRTLRVLDQVFYQKMQSVLSPEELACIFLNLSHVYELHASLCEAMKKRRQSPIVQGIGDIMLARFEEQVSHLCSQQSQALELIKSKQRKDPRFAHLIQECEASPHCRRLQLKDLLLAEMQRLTKYPLLLDNIIKHTETASPDLQLLQRAQARCRGILQAVNEVVRETEHRHRLGQYQRRLDLTPVERLANPVAAQFKNLDLTTKRMIHEAPLTWKVSKDKAIGKEVQALLLSDLLVLLQRGADERLVLRCPSRSLGGAPDLKTPFCPILRLDSALVRSVATGQTSNAMHLYTSILYLARNYPIEIYISSKITNVNNALAINSSICIFLLWYKTDQPICVMMHSSQIVLQHDIYNTTSLARIRLHAYKPHHHSPTLRGSRKHFFIRKRKPNLGRSFFK